METATKTYLMTFIMFTTFKCYLIHQLHLAVAVLDLHTAYILTKNGLQYGWFHGNCLKFSGESFFRVPRVTNIFMNSGSTFNI